MNFEDYVNHVTQKYRLALSIAVLKSKPEHLSIDQYITILKNKMNDRSNNIDESDDMEISICSEEFALDDNNAGHIINDIFNDNSKNNETEHINNDTSTRNTDAVHTIDDTSSDMEIETDVNNSMTILKDLDVNVRTVGDPAILNIQSDSVSDVLNILRNIEEDRSLEKSNYIFELENYTQMTCYEDSQVAYNTISLKPNDEDTINNDKNAQYDILGQNNKQKENLFEDGTEHTQFIDSSLAAKISKNISNLVTDDSKRNEIRKRSYDAKTFINRDNSSKNSQDVRTTMTDTIENPNNIVNMVTINLEELNQSEYSNEQNNYLASKVYQNLTKQSDAEIDKANDDRLELNMSIDLEEPNHCEYNYKCDDKTGNRVCKNLNKPVHLNDNIQKDSQETQLYSLHGFSQAYTHVSQSQIENVDINKKFILGNKERNTESYENCNNVEEAYLPSNYTISANVDKENQTQTGESIEKKTRNVNNKTPQIIEINSDEIQYLISINGKHYKIPNLNCLVNDRNTYNIVEEQKSEMCASKIHTQTSKSNENTEKHPNNEVFENAAELQDTNALTENEYEHTQAYPDTLSTQNSESEEDLTVSQKEMIPFKVIEELNKVKMYLSRKEIKVSTDGNNTDSGYKSDSQSRSSYKSALQSETWLNQSAHCLLSYLLHSPLVAAAQGITREISQVLGKLIDRLHEDEKYPSFLDNLLESIGVMLQDVYQGGSGSDNVFMKMDENIQRLFLLNKSLHILKYTIEKINNILENVHSFLTSEETYELTNIEHTENICYIFHILEALIKRYLKNKLMSTQDSTQTSQNENTLLKKSSITDIWRKKWNPDYKTAKFEVHVEKRCVLSKCGDALNKIIVDCMEGYSLVAFAALQCFNLLQSQ